MDKISEGDFQTDVLDTHYRATTLRLELNSPIDEKGKSLKDDLKIWEDSQRNVNENDGDLSSQIAEYSENDELSFTPKRCENPNKEDGEYPLKIYYDVASSPIFSPESRNEDLSFSPIRNSPSPAYESAEEISNLVKKQEKGNSDGEADAEEDNSKSPNETSPNAFKKEDYYYLILNKMSPSVQINSSDMSVEHATDDITDSHIYHDISCQFSSLSSSKNSSDEEENAANVVQSHCDVSVLKNNEHSNITEFLKAQNKIEDSKQHGDALKVPRKKLSEKDDCLENEETAVLNKDKTHNSDNNHKKEIKIDTKYEKDKKLPNDQEEFAALETPSIQTNRQGKPNLLPHSHTKSLREQDKDIENKSKENMRFKLPNESVCAKIIRQAESYFTDFNVLKNNFLLKHMRRNKEGYVSLKLVTSFRKVKTLTRDWTVVAHCLANSKMLELNPEKTKVRRIVPVPKIEDTSFGKTIVIFNLPFQNTTTEQLINMFGRYGNIVFAEVMNRESKNYNLYHQRCLFFNQEISSYIFGVVEFERFKDAQNAIKDNESHFPKENKMVVVPLLSKYKNRKRKFRYRSFISYPRPSYDRFVPKTGYAKEAYPPKISSDPKLNKNYNNNDILPMGKFSYWPNYYKGYYRQNYITKQPMYYPKSRYGNIQETKNGHDQFKTSENWRSNRQLKANTSMNIDKRGDPSIPKIVNSTKKQIGTKVESV